MDGPNGTITVEFADLGSAVAADMLEFINESLPLGSKLATDDVMVRAMYVTSDGVNTQGGRFRNEDLGVLCSLIPGVPVMIGHDKSKLPIGKCFRSELVERDGTKWVKAWFYWLVATSEAHDLRTKIDGGVCSECSLSFSFTVPECSICGGDIRRCSHLAGKSYCDEVGRMQTCHFRYAGIKAVNEISLVYKGAVPGTAIARCEMHLSSSVGADLGNASSLAGSEITFDIASIDLPESGATATPVYHGLPVRLTATDGSVYLDMPCNWADMDAARQIVSQCRSELATLGEAEGVLVFMRGRSRLPLHAIEAALYSVGQSCRCRIKLYLDEEVKSNCSKSVVEKLEICGIDVVGRTHIHDSIALVRVASCAPHEGLRIVSDDIRLVYRPMSRFLLTVKDIVRHQSGRFCYDLAFGDDLENVFRSYESRIAADIGDTLYVDAVVDASRGAAILQKVKTLDNLRSYFQPDLKPRGFPKDATERYELYALAPDKAALRLVSNSQCLCVLFPSFSARQLLRGKTLVGHGLPESDDVRLRHCIDVGIVTDVDPETGGRILAFRGGTIRGKFVIRPAVLLREKVWLLHRAA